MILSDQTILGMDKMIFIFIFIFIFILFLFVFIFYLSIVFVKSGYVKIVERFGRYKKTIYSPRGFIIPVIDKVVCELDMGLLVFDSKTQITILGKDEKLFKITYGLTYFINDPSIYYQTTNGNIDKLEDIVSKIIIDYYDSSHIVSAKDLYDFNNNTLLCNLSNRLLMYSIKVDDFVIRTIE